MKILLIVSVLGIGAVCGYFGIAHVAANGIRREDATLQTKLVTRAATDFLNTLHPEQKRKVSFDFTATKTAVIARFHRTSDGGVAPGAPAISAGIGGHGEPPHGNPPQ